MSNKKTGSYYTPEPIANFMVKYVFNKIKDKNISILEPSVGDGVFIESINKTSFSQFKERSLTLIDINKEELHKAKNKINTKFAEITIHNNDFLEYQQKCQDRFSLIIGNPPYINKKLLSKEIINLCERVHCTSKLSNNKINNIWTSFVVSSIKLLKSNGIMAFVLPSDILQVKYAQEIRVLLEKQFERLEIFNVNMDHFKEIEQQIVILFAYKKANRKGVFFFEFIDLNENKFNQISSNGLIISNTKWTHYQLTEKEIKLLNSINKKLPRVSDIITSNAAIVTGANDYFILPQSKVNKYNFESFCKPIIRKSSFVNGSVILTKSCFNKIVKEDKPAYLLSLENIDFENISNNKLKEYLEIGKSLQLNKRYKCSKRKDWYIVPYIKKPPSAFFFKRSHNLLKLIRNSANVYATDAAYNISVKKNYHINDFIYSFYNIVTLIFAELLGRKYGGGVLELTPNEFKSLPIQYLKTSKAKFSAFTRKFENNTKKTDLIIRKSELTLRKSLNINSKDFDSLLNIYFKLTRNRINTSASTHYK